MKTNLKTLAYLLLFNFIIIIFTLTYWQVIRKDDLYAHPRNRRLLLLEEKSQRGKILDRNGKEIAYSEKKGDQYIRRYPYKEAVAHIVGYNSKQYGKAGLEQFANSYLLGLPGREDIIPFLPGTEVQNVGYNVVTTIDMELQQLANRLMEGNKGAVVALNPKTGEILCLLSKPSYDPNNIEAIWDTIQQDDEKSVFLNRTVQGMYPPGSTLKIVTGAGALKFDPKNWTRIFNAKGYIEVKGHRIADNNIKGNINFKQALQYSSNYVFATLGLEMGAENFYNTLNDFGLNEKVQLELPTTQGRVTEPDELNPEKLAETAIGQGELLLTPLHMALVTEIVANGGQRVEPYLVDRVVSPEGKVLFTNKTSSETRIIAPQVSSKLAEAMLEVVKSGTGKNAAVSGIKIAGKTGSAQNPHGNTHAWFVGYAPFDNPEIVIAVIIENGGSGGKVAAPVARELFRTAIINKG